MVSPVIIGDVAISVEEAMNGLWEMHIARYHNYFISIMALEAIIVVETRGFFRDIILRENCYRQDSEVLNIHF